MSQSSANVQFKHVSPNGLKWVYEGVHQGDDKILEFDVSVGFLGSTSPPAALNVLADTVTLNYPA